MYKSFGYVGPRVQPHHKLNSVKVKINVHQQDLDVTILSMAVLIPDVGWVDLDSSSFQ